jgi:hypothetical protein
VALVEMAQSACSRFPALRRINEVPFDSSRMRQSVVYETPNGPVLYCKGAPEAVVPLCRQTFSSQIGPLDLAYKQTITEAQEAMQIPSSPRITTPIPHLKGSRCVNSATLFQQPARHSANRQSIVSVTAPGAISRVAAQRSEMRSMLADSGGAGLLVGLRQKNR